MCNILEVIEKFNIECHNIMIFNKVICINFVAVFSVKKPTDHLFLDAATLNALFHAYKHSMMSIHEPSICT